MTKIDALATLLAKLNPAQLQKLNAGRPNRDGSLIRLARNRRTEAYFARVKAEGLYPHNFDTFAQFREVLP